MRLRGTGFTVAVVYDRSTMRNIQPTPKHHFPCQQRMEGTALGSRFVRRTRTSLSGRTIRQAVCNDSKEPTESSPLTYLDMRTSSPQWVE